jgi:hypothetical protein
LQREKLKGGFYYKSLVFYAIFCYDFSYPLSITQALTSYLCIFYYINNPTNDCPHVKYIRSYFSFISEQFLRTNYKFRNSLFMIDQAFTETLLSDFIYKSDFYENDRLRDPTYKQSVIAQAKIRTEIGFNNSAELIINNIKGKKVFRFKNIADEIVLRKISAQIKKITHVKQQDRNDIICNLICTLEECFPYVIIKLDIKDFYESIDTKIIINKIYQDPIISRQTYKLIDSFFRFFENRGIKGLPRGMSISATLAEYFMRNYDNKIKYDERIFYYSRFVDDMIFVIDSRYNKRLLIKDLKNILPIGLKFNINKRDSFDIVKIPNRDPNENINSFDFLGYNFKVSNYDKNSNHNKKDNYRKVIVEISEKKVKRIKTRIIMSFIDYLCNNDYTLLYDRIKLLTGNYSLLDRRRGVIIKTGIYFKVIR